MSALASRSTRMPKQQITSSKIRQPSGHFSHATMVAAGGRMDDICRVDVYVRNMEHFEQIHKVRREYFRPPAPASTMVEVCKMTSPEYLIEINAIAVIGE